MVVGGTRRDDSFSRIKSLVSTFKGRLGISNPDETKLEASSELNKATSVDPQTATINIAAIAKDIAKKRRKLNLALQESLDLTASGANEKLRKDYLQVKNHLLDVSRIVGEAFDVYDEKRFPSVQDSIEFIEAISPYIKAHDSKELIDLINQLPSTRELMQIRCLAVITEYEKEHKKLERSINSAIANFKAQYLPLEDLKQALVDELTPSVERLCPEKSVVLARLKMLEVQSSNFNEEFFTHLDDIIQLLNPESKKAGIEVPQQYPELTIVANPTYENTEVGNIKTSSPLSKRDTAHSLSFTNLEPFYERIREQATRVDPCLESTSSFTFAKLIADTRMRKDISYVLKNFPSNLQSKDREEFEKYFIDNPALLQETFQENHSQGGNRGQEFYEQYLNDLSILASAKIQARLNTKLTSNFNNSSINPNTASGKFTVKYLSNLAVSAILQDFSEKIISKAFPDDEQAALPYRELTQQRINKINSENEKLLLAQKQYVESLNQEKSTSPVISPEERKSLLKQKFANYQGNASTLNEIYLDIINKLNTANAELKYPASLNAFLTQCARQKYGKNPSKETLEISTFIKDISSTIPKYNLDELKLETEKYFKEYVKQNLGSDPRSLEAMDYEKIYESFTKTDSGKLKVRALSLDDFKAVHNPDQKFWEDLFSVHSFNKAHNEKIQSVIELGKNLSSFDNSILYNILLRTGLAEDKVFNFIDDLKDFTKLSFPAQEKFAKDFNEAIGDLVIEKLIADSDSVKLVNMPAHDACREIKPAVVNIEAENQVDKLALESLGRFTDNLIKLFDDRDQELIQFIENQAVKKIWLSLFKVNPEINPQTDIKDLGLSFEPSAFMQKVYSKFEKEFEQIKNIELPENYNTENPIKPNLMQRYVAFKLNEIGHFANWSNPGSGKTLSAIYAAMLNEATDTKNNGHNILVIGANSTIENEEEWAASISSFDKKAKLLIKSDYESPAFQASDRDNGVNNYFLYNYEAFQADKSESLVKALSNKTFDTIVLDEVHLIKSADSKRNTQISALIQRARENNPELKLLLMSATPIVNNLDEGKEIIKVLTGLDRLDVDTSKVSSKTILDMNRLLMNTGIRFEKAYPQKLEIKKIPIVLDLAQSFDRPLIQEIIDSINKEGRNLLDLEQSLSKAKRSTVIANLSPGTIVYSKFVSGIIDEMAAAIQDSRDLKVGLYTGENKAGYLAFKNRLAKNNEDKVDVLVASSALGLGVNLQDTGHSMVINSLPWSAAEMEQLLGRIYREGSNAEKISVVIPLVYLQDANGEMFSYDEKRLNLIENKGALADLVLSGEPLRDEFSSEAKLLADAEKAIGTWQKQIYTANNLDMVQAMQINTETYPDLKHDFQSGSGLLSPSATTHKLLSTASSKTVGEYYKAHPEEWDLIHEIYNKYESEWGRDNVPRNVLAKKINSIIGNANQKRLGSGKPEKIFTIGDFGCGKFQLASHLNPSMTKVYGFDYISADPSNPNIISCDMANIPRKDPVKDGLLDIAVFSLSLHHDSLRERQGVKSFLNIPNYLSEANKLLKARGTLMIALPSHNWAGERLSVLIKDINEAGFEIQMTERGKPVRRIGSDKFMYIFAKKSAPALNT